MTIGAVLSVRLARVFVRLGGMEWPYASMDEFNRAMEDAGRPDRMGRWEALAQLEHFREMREMLRWIGTQPVLPWERLPQAEEESDHEQQ